MQFSCLYFHLDLLIFKLLNLANNNLMFFEIRDKRISFWFALQTSARPFFLILFLTLRSENEVSVPLPAESSTYLVSLYRHKSGWRPENSQRATVTVGTDLFRFVSCISASKLSNPYPHKIRHSRSNTAVTAGRRSRIYKYLLNSIRDWCARREYILGCLV